MGTKEKYMSPQQIYTLSTIGYGIVGILSAVGIPYFLTQQNYFLSFISVLILLVCLDNFFCGSRAKVCNKGIKTHYVIPPFLKKRQHLYSPSLSITLMKGNNLLLSVCFFILATMMYLNFDISHWQTWIAVILFVIAGILQLILFIKKRR